MLESLSPWELGGIISVTGIIITGLVVLFVALNQKKNSTQDNADARGSGTLEETSDTGVNTQPVAMLSAVEKYGISQDAFDKLENIARKKEPDILNAEADLKNIIDQYKKLEHRLENRPEDVCFVAEAKEELKAGNLERAENLLLESYEKYVKLIEKDKALAAEDAFELGCVKEMQIEYEAAAQYYKQAINFDPKNSLYLNAHAFLMLNIGEYKEAVPFLERALEIDKEACEEENVAVDLNNLGNTCKFSGEYKKAVEYFAKAIETGNRSFRENDPRISQYLNNLGASWESAGEYDKAVKFFEDALKTGQKPFVKKDHNIALGMNHPGFVWESLGKYNKVLEQYKNLEQRLEKRQADDFIVQAKKELTKGNLEKAEEFLIRDYEKHVARIEKNKELPAEDSFELGSLSRLTFEYETARKYYEQSVTLAPHNSLYLNELGTLLHELGDYRNAIPFLEKALKIDRNAYGENLPDVAIHLNNLGAAWKSLGRYNKAIDYFEKALAIDRSTFGERHPRIGARLNNLGATWRSLSKYKKAVDYFQNGLTVVENDFGNDDTMVVIHLGSSSNAWKSSGTYNKSINYFNKALEIFEKADDEQICYIAACLNNLGAQWHLSGNYKRAVDYFEKALATFEKTDGEHVVTYISTCLNNLGKAWHCLGQHNTAIDYLEKALVIVRNEYHEEHIHAGHCLSNLGDVWHSLGDYNRAFEHFEGALVIFKKACHERHTNVGICLQKLGSVWESSGEYEKAIDYFEKTERIFFEELGKKHPQTQLIGGRIKRKKSSMPDNEENDGQESKNRE